MVVTRVCTALLVHKHFCFSASFIVFPGP